MFSNSVFGDFMFKEKDPLNLGSFFHPKSIILDFKNIIRIFTSQIKNIVMRKLSNYLKLKVYNSRKRRGDIERIEIKTGYSMGHISNVLNGNRVNDEIVAVAYKIAAKRKINKERNVQGFPERRK